MKEKNGKKNVLTQEKLLEERLVSKGIDQFITALEMINNPSKKYRSENFAFNITNAWELILKAQIIRDFGESEIYFKNQKNRTIGLQQCLDKLFTDISNPIKKNIEIIAKLRNLSVHFITPEYDGLYISTFQANVLYFVEYTKNTFNKNMNDKVPSYFLTIATDPTDISNVRLMNRIDSKSFDKFLKKRNELNTNSFLPGQTVSFEVRMKAVKKDEDITFKLDRNSDVSAQVINRILDPSNSHPYRQIDIICKINEEFGENTLNQYTFRAIREYEKLFDNEEFYYYHKQSNSKTYSEKAYNLIRKNIEDTPNYVDICATEYKKK